MVAQPVVYDIDGNGIPDVIVGRTVWVNEGSGRFTAGRLLGTSDVEKVAVGDINRDGLPDMFVVNFGVDWSAPPESMLKTRRAEVWLNTSQLRRS